MTSLHPESASPSESAWRRFWNRGGWWKALLAALVYLALYLGAGQLVGLLFGSQLDTKNPLADVQSVFFGIALPILIGSVLLIVFAASLGWLRELFGRQPIRGRGWMWIAPAVVLVTAGLRIAGTDYASYSAGVVVTVYATGLFIGFAEELITRGIAVDLLRRRGYSERVVMVLSSVIFALMHSTNVLSGQAPLTVGVTMVFTFVFGVAMYLTMRVTGSLIWAMLLHAVTDPTTLLAAGGVDTTGGAPISPLAATAGLSTWVYLLLTVVALFAVRGRVRPRELQPAVPLPA